MTPTLIDFFDSDLDISVYALAMRSAYVVTGNVIIMGTNWDNYNTMHLFPTWPEKDQITLMKSITGKEDWAKLDDTMEVLRILRSKKRLGQAEIVALKKTEKYLKQCVDVSLKRSRDAIYGYGFMEIDDKFINTKTLGIFSLGHEGKENKENDECSISTLLLDIYSSNDSDNEQTDPNFALITIMLTDDFFEWCNGKHTLYNTDSEAANQSGHLFMTTCFSIPNTTKLSLDEIILANRTMKTGLDPWRTAASQWIKTSIENETEMVNNYFAHVQMHNQSAQETIDNNMVMENAKKSRRTGDHVEVMLGLIPFAVMLDFYKDMKVIPDDSWQILQKELAENPKINRRYPVIGTRFTGEKYYKTDPPPDAETFAALSRKKFLSVD